MNTFPQDANEPAMPLSFDKAATSVHDYNGFTKRERAAIDLKVPDSGSDWLDKMILDSRRWDTILAAERIIKPSANPPISPL